MQPTQLHLPPPLLVAPSSATEITFFPSLTHCCRNRFQPQHSASSAFSPTAAASSRPYTYCRCPWPPPTPSSSSPTAALIIPYRCILCFLQLFYPISRPPLPACPPRPLLHSLATAALFLLFPAIYCAIPLCSSRCPCLPPLPSLQSQPQPSLPSTLLPLPAYRHCCYPSCSLSIVDSTSSSTTCCLSPSVVAVLPRPHTVTVADVLPCCSPRYYRLHRASSTVVVAAPLCSAGSSQPCPPRPPKDSLPSSSYPLPRRTPMLVRPDCFLASSSSSDPTASLLRKQRLQPILLPSSPPLPSRLLLILQSHPIAATEPSCSIHTHLPLLPTTYRHRQSYCGQVLLHL
ncbi:hypothetical protein BHE74_00010587 [Ensete ventricosum]|nr:hypothetical protein BHE74_00010587 [Ensete ventricosum]